MPHNWKFAPLNRLPPIPPPLASDDHKSDFFFYEFAGFFVLFLGSTYKQDHIAFVFVVEHLSLCVLRINLS